MARLNRTSNTPAPIGVGARLRREGARGQTRLDGGSRESIPRTRQRPTSSTGPPLIARWSVEATSPSGCPRRPSPPGTLAERAREARPRKYSDLAIESTLTRRLLFHRPRRQTEGCLTSLFVLLGLDLRAPDHTITTVKSLGRRRWKQTSHDPQHARVENACFRSTSIIGDGLRARTPGGRTVEAPLACTMLNAMPDRGRPASYAVGR